MWVHDRDCHSRVIFETGVKYNGVEHRLLVLVTQEEHRGLKLGGHGAGDFFPGVFVEGVVLLLVVGNITFLKFVPFRCSCLAYSFLGIPWAWFRVLACCFFHDFPIVTKTLDNKFACGRFNTKFPGGPANGIALAWCQIDELDSFLIGNNTIPMILILTTSLLLLQILLDTELTFLIFIKEVHLGWHSAQLFDYKCSNLQTYLFFAFRVLFCVLFRFIVRGSFRVIVRTLVRTLFCHRGLVASTELVNFIGLEVCVKIVCLKALYLLILISNARKILYKLTLKMRQNLNSFPKPFESQKLNNTIYSQIEHNSPNKKYWIFFVILPTIIKNPQILLTEPESHSLQI